MSLIPAFFWYYYVPRYINPSEGLVADSASLANTMFSKKGWALRIYFWLEPATWKLLLLSRPLEYHFTPSGSLVLILAAAVFLKREVFGRGLRDCTARLGSCLRQAGDDEACVRILKTGIVLHWMLGIFCFVLAFPVFNSLHEYYQIPLLLPASMLLALALSYLGSQPFFADKKRYGALVLFLYGGILIYGGYKLYHRLQVRTEVLQLAEVIRKHTKNDEKIVILHSLPKPELFYYSGRRGYIIGVFAHADKLPSASASEYTRLAKRQLREYAKRGVRTFVIPKNDWPPLAAPFLAWVEGHCPKTWSEASGIRGLYSTHCKFEK